MLYQYEVTVRDLILQEQVMHFSFRSPYPMTMKATDLLIGWAYHCAEEQGYAVESVLLANVATGFSILCSGPKYS